MKGTPIKLAVCLFNKDGALVDCLTQTLYPEEKSIFAKQLQKHLNDGLDITVQSKHDRLHSLSKDGDNVRIISTLHMSDLTERTTVTTNGTVVDGIAISKYIKTPIIEAFLTEEL